MEAEKQAFKSLMHFDIDGNILFTDFRGHISYSCQKRQSFDFAYNRLNSPGDNGGEAQL